MYIPTPDELGSFNLAKVRSFIDYWSSFYSDNWEESHYFDQLNLGRDLTDENVRKLLSWKSRRFLAGRSDGKENPHVAKVLRNLDSLNRFRRGEITEGEMRAIVGTIYPEGFVWNVFLLHIAKPQVCPIVDRNVLQSWAAHTHGRNNLDWKVYAAYSNYFATIAEALGIPRTTDEVRELKRIDNALFEYGRFLESHLEKAEAAAASNHS